MVTISGCIKELEYYDYWNDKRFCNKDYLNKPVIYELECADYNTGNAVYNAEDAVYNAEDAIYTTGEAYISIGNTGEIFTNKLGMIEYGMIEDEEFEYLIL